MMCSRFSRGCYVVGVRTFVDSKGAYTVAKDGVKFGEVSIIRKELIMHHEIPVGMYLVDEQVGFLN